METGNRCHRSSIVDRALFFYPKLSEDFFSLNASNGPYSVNSRQLVTNFLDPSTAKWSHLDQGTENVLTCESPVILTTTTAEAATGSSATTQPEMTTAVIETTMTAIITTTYVYVSPTVILEDNIRLAVINRSGLSSQLQAIILVCACTFNMHVYMSF